MMTGVAAGLSAVAYLFVLLVDPYDTLPFSPSFEREPISTNARFSFPALAAKSRFDSAMIGTSTTRLLRPDRFNDAFRARFVNLSMNSATTYEQQRIFDLFVDHHPRPRVIIFGLDDEWCATGAPPPRFTSRPFPAWLYDGAPWNDPLFLFNASAMEQAGRQFARLVGLRKPKYGLDGYTYFLPPPARYDPARARQTIYQGMSPRRSAIPLPAHGYRDQLGGRNFPTHSRLRRMLRRLPDGVLKVILFMPAHHFSLAVPGTLQTAIWARCKQLVATIASRHANSHVLDFRIRSRITLDDTNYWDRLHYKVEIADMLAALIKTGVMTRAGRDGYFDYLRGE